MKEHRISYLLANSNWWCGLNVTNFGNTITKVLIEYYNSDTGTLVRKEEISLNAHCGKRFLVDIPYGWARVITEDHVAISEFIGELVDGKGIGTLYVPIDGVVLAPAIVIPPVVPPVVPPVLPPPSTAKLVWQTTKAEALNLALTQGKKVLLLGGRESCETTKGMRDIACESIEPSCPIKALIQQHFVPWYGNSDLNQEYYAYMAPGIEYILPAIRVIDPKNPGIAIPISEGNQNFVMIYNKMLENV